MPLPSFLILGAYKAGTTAINYLLADHPDIYMSPRKESRYFSYDPSSPGVGGSNGRRMRSIPVSSLAEYERLFAGARSERAIGEASPSYLPSVIAPARIRDTLDHPRLIAILRDPAERAFSHLLMNANRTYSTLPNLRIAATNFDEHNSAMASDLRRILEIGFYSSQINRYWDVFPKEQLRIYLYEDFTSEPERVIHDICNFLGVTTDWTPDTSQRHNVSGIPKNEIVNRVMNTARQVANPILPRLPARLTDSLVRIRNHTMERVKLSVDERASLIELYRDDILRLETMLDRDLARWLTV